MDSSVHGKKKKTKSISVKVRVASQWGTFDPFAYNSSINRWHQVWPSEVYSSLCSTLSYQPKKKIRSQNEGNLLPEVFRLLLSIFNLWPGLVTKLCLILAAAWTVACQAPLSMGIPRQVYWNRLPFPFPGDLPDPGIDPVSPALLTNCLPT